MRILILGSGGAGKSTLARQLGRELGLPVVHIDRIYWSPGWKGRPDEEWVPELDSVMQGEAWIVDGNYSRTLPARLKRAQAAVFLDYSRWTCLAGVLRRLATYYGRTRADLPEGCPESIDWEFLRWVWDYPRRSRGNTLARLEAAAQCGVAVYRIRRRSELAGLARRLKAEMSDAVSPGPAASE